MSAFHQYPLGRTPKEYARLERQADIYAPLTSRLFDDAGIASGMRVLDLGSGAGDICMMLSEIVGSDGSVVGLDVDAAAIEHARNRASAASRHNIAFACNDFESYLPEEQFDAIVGRMVLMYQPDPSAALAAAVRHLKPGGIVAMQEPWLHPSSGPFSHTQHANACIIETFRRSGTHLDVGPRLHRIFSEAGLPVPKMRWEAMMDGDPESSMFQVVAETLESVLPKAIELGVAREGEFDLEAIAGRIRNEMGLVGYAMLTAPLVSAWCRASI